MLVGDSPDTRSEDESAIFGTHSPKLESLDGPVSQTRYKAGTPSHSDIGFQLTQLPRWEGR